VVLSRVLAVALILAATACGESLFDDHGSTDGGGVVPSTCPETCLADAAADFDGTAGGIGMHWQYLDDNRDRTWTEMDPFMGLLIGIDPANTITSCTLNPLPATCIDLPGGLLVSTAGATSMADPSISYTAPTSQIIQLSLRIRVPGGASAHDVRLYRNSREDVLFTGSATPGIMLEAAVTVDALAGDRFLLAIAPTEMGAANIGVQFFVNATGAAFPARCQMAIPFTAATGNTVDNLCGADATNTNETSGAIPPVLAAGPFAELGQGADITPTNYYEAAGVLDRSGDTTVQLWVRLDALVDTYAAWPFSDLDLDAGGGLGIAIYEQSGRKIEISTCTSGTPLELAADAAAYPADTAWHFIRAVHTKGNVKLCVDGKQVTSIPVAAGKLASTYHPYIGKNVVWTPSGAFFDGGIDDVRVFSEALPCN
jgi:hypothetical protein